MAMEIDMDRVQVDNPAKSAANIEWNVDMNVSVSNAKQSKLFQRSHTIVFFLLAIFFSVTLYNLKTEVRALQAQVQLVNMKYMLLVTRYDRINRIKRASHRRFEKMIHDKSSHDVERLANREPFASKAAEIIDEVRNESSRADNRALPHSDSIRSSRDKRAIRDPDFDDGNEGENEIVVSKALREFEDNETTTSDNNLRIERAILTIGKERATTEKEIRSSREMIVDDSASTNYDYYDSVDDNDGESELGMRREPRSGRSKRDEGRGKKRGENKWRPKRSHRRLGPLVATFVGAIPEQHVTDAVYIGPWVRSTKNDSQYSLNKFHLVENKRSIEITQTGLYMISAQIFYFGEPTNYSYWILLNSEGKSNTERLVKCSTSSSISATEISCYTSVITLLRRGDRVHLQQQEKDRLINMREGHSYIQLLLLSKPIAIRKKRFR